MDYLQVNRKQVYKQTQFEFYVCQCTTISLRKPRMDGHIGFQTLYACTNTCTYTHMYYTHVTNVCVTHIHMHTCVSHIHTHTCVTHIHTHTCVTHIHTHTCVTHTYTHMCYTHAYTHMLHTYNQCSKKNFPHRLSKPKMATSNSTLLVSSTSALPWYV